MGTRIIADVDFDSNGKQVSWLGVPVETDASAYGLVPIPIIVLKNGQGPTAILSAGVHGDEYEGQIALLKLARTLDPDQIRGRIIILPALNLPAVLKAQRLSPLDGRNLNRSYPGDPAGGVTPAIAHYVSTVLLPMTEIHLDLHSGGRSLEYVPCVNLNQTHDQKTRDADLEARTLAALKVFGAPIGLINRDLDTTGHPSHLYQRLGILSLGTELGGSGIVNRFALRVAERGIRNLLFHFKMMDGRVVAPEEDGDPATRLVVIPDLKCYEMAPESGIYEPLADLGQPVALGQALGQVHFPAMPTRAPCIVHARRAGMLLCKRSPGWVEHGDNVAIIASDYID